jgi:hypothetical protein
MIFSQRQIELARELKAFGLCWTPATGHYVYDEEDRIQETSVFQQGVYLFLDDDDFTDHFGSIEQLKDSLIWLPSWTDAREVLRSMGVHDEDVELELVRRSAIAKGTELLTLYEMIAQELSEKKLQVIYNAPSLG